MVKITYLFPLCLANIIKFSQEFSHTWKISQGVLKKHKYRRFFKKLGIKLPYDLAIPLLGIYPEETGSEKDTCIPFIAALFTIARTWKRPRRPLTDE